MRGQAILCLATLLLSMDASAQAAPRSRDTSRVPGWNETGRRFAIKAKRHAYASRDFIARLGYIDTSFTTPINFRNNVPLGLVVLPADKGCRITGYDIAIKIPGEIVTWGFHVDGRDLYHLERASGHPLRAWVGTVYTFENIELKCPGSNIKFSLEPFSIRIVNDSSFLAMLKCPCKRQ